MKRSAPFTQLLVAVTILFLAMNAISQTTAFSYQGSLTDNGSTANGSFQFQFKLFDAVSGGTQIGATLENITLNVVDGIFSTKLDFGAGVLTGANRFLEIAVRRNAGEPFITLSPREQIASAPYAVRTLSAVQADTALDAEKLGGVAANEYVTSASLNTNAIRNQATLQSPANFNISGSGYFGGRVGIGTTTPAGLLHVQSPLTFAPIYIRSAAGFAEETTFRLQTDTGITGQGKSFGIYSDNASAYRLFINGNGNVGVGTTAPSSRLEIAAQNGLAITGFQPYFTLRDTNNANKRGIIQSADGKLLFYPNSTIGGNPLLVLNDNGLTGIGTTAPNAKLSISGGPIWTSNAWTAGFNMPNGSAVGWTANASGQRFGIGQSGGGLYFFRTTSDFGNTANQATYDLVIQDNGNISQGRDKNGLVKALLKVHETGAIIRCYNSTTGVSAGSCGFAVSRPETGIYDINFGFEIGDRFVVAQGTRESGGCVVPVASINAQGGDFMRIRMSCASNLNDDNTFFLVVF
ncbi:MAG: hypothetical protein QUS14_08340 [Pyrinomonadaceae bacterium]|nr:hypothetical protein [Pyrinomonadaceae bacterium]